MNYVISIDIGTQGTKGGIFDENLNLLLTAFRPSNLITDKSGAVYQESLSIYKSVLDVIYELLQRSCISSENVHAIAVDSQMAGIMGIEENGDAITYYDSWLDTRCKKFADKIDHIAGDRVLSLTGSPVTCAHGPKILWWKNCMPSQYNNIAKFVVPHCYVSCKMAGKNAQYAYLDYTCLQYSGFGDNEKKSWSRELLDLFQIDPKKMPNICSPFTVIGNVSEKTAQITGLTPETKILAGCGDTAASILGAGLFNPGEILDCAGTASVLCGVVDSYCPDSPSKILTLMRSPIDGFWYPLAYINGGGLCLRWLKETLSSSYEKLEKSAAQVPCGSEGLFFLPHFSGRNSPSNPYMKGSFTGLDFHHTSGHMYRSIMEGISYEYILYYEALKKLYSSLDISSLTSIGGGSKSDLFLQIKSDALALPITAFQICDTALLGSAAIAGVGAGFFTDCRPVIKKQLQIRQQLTPICQNSLTYRNSFYQYKNLLRIMSDFYNNKP